MDEAQCFCGQGGPGGEQLCTLSQTKGEVLGNKFTCVATLGQLLKAQWRLLRLAHSLHLFLANLIAIIGKNEYQHFAPS